MKTLDSLIGIAAITTVIHAGYRIWPGERSDPYAIGEVVSEPAVYLDAGEFGREQTTLPASIAPSTCKYIVVFSQYCSACSTLAYQWLQDFEHESQQPLLPAGWTPVWMSVDEAPVKGHFLDLPVELYSAVEREAWLTRFDIQAVPYHIVLNHKGKVVSHGGGGTLLRRQAFRPDCTLDRSTSSP